MSPEDRLITDRLITAHEAALVRWMLEHAAMRDLSAYQHVAVEELRIVSWCDCGCCSLAFRKHTPGQVILADATAEYEDGQVAGLILWGRDGELSLLEVYDCHPESSKRVPEIANLRSGEPRGQKNLER
jgi:hypothetical protein